MARPHPVTAARYLRVGHKGAAALAPGNTIASIAAAIDHGVDMIEFDVVDAPDGRLVLGHSHDEIEPNAVALDEALAFVAAEAPPETHVDVDLKWHGFEPAVVAALRAHGLERRALVCSFFAHSLRAVRRAGPTVRTGISYPWDRRGLSTSRLLSPVVPACVAALRAALPFRIAGLVASADASAAMIHHAVLSRRTVERCHALRVPVFAWTVDDPSLLAETVALGVDGVISNDPRIFGSDGEHRYDSRRAGD